jgi:hypothetical protein
MPTNHALQPSDAKMSASVAGRAELHLCNPLRRPEITRVSRDERDQVFWGRGRKRRN